MASLDDSFKDQHEVVPDELRRLGEEIQEWLGDYLQGVFSGYSPTLCSPARESDGECYRNAYRYPEPFVDQGAQAAFMRNLKTAVICEVCRMNPFGRQFFLALPKGGRQSGRPTGIVFLDADETQRIIIWFYTDEYTTHKPYNPALTFSVHSSPGAPEDYTISPSSDPRSGP